MENHGGNKISGIRQIVRLKGFLQKWQNAALGSKRSYRELNNRRHNGGISPAVSRRLKSVSTCCDSDEDSCMSPETHHDIPRGYLAVYVGRELRRFIIPTSYLVDPLFKVLLEKVEEEFGFDHSGALNIPCEIETFKYLLNVMENRQKNQGALENLNSAEHQLILA